MVLTREEVLRKLRKNQDKIRSFGVKRIGVFGSVARGDANEKSDIDFVVEFEEGKKSYDNFISLLFFLKTFLEKRLIFSPLKV